MAGILIEADSQAGGIAGVVGIGLNVSVDTGGHPEIAATATSLAEEAGSRLWNARSVLVDLLRSIRRPLCPSTGRQVPHA